MPLTTFLTLIITVMVLAAATIALAQYAAFPVVWLGLGALLASLALRCAKWS